MASDILVVTQEIIELLTKHELSRVQSIFVVEAVKMQINENIVRDIIEDTKKGHDIVAGIG